jgi:amino acid adenylation domain-containing protein/non-ribosomal peptide synthase protein (TIGR01720 family)
LSSVADLLQQLNQQGIRLYLAQGELRFKAPKGAMTPEIMERLKANKSELTTLLQQAAETHSALAEPLGRFADSSVVPLSFAQQRLWFLFKLEGASPTYNILMASRLSGDLDVDLLRRSFEYLIGRHESLRTTFSETSEGVARQVVHPALALKMEVDDFSAYPESQKQALLDQAKSLMAGIRFDLEQAPLSQVKLIRYGQSEWVLLMAMHHIIGDGWSMGILSRELGAAYQSYLANAEPDFTPIDINYRDYSVWQQRPQQHALIEQGVKRWCRLLENSEYRLDLNTGKLRPESKSYRGSTCPVLIAPELTRQLEQLAEREGVSLFVLLLTAYFILLQRYSGRNDLLVGTQAANRNEPGLEPIVGFFINTIPLRARIEANPRIKALLAQVNDFCLNAFDLQYVPFERLVEALKPERDFGSNPLVQIMFLWQNAPIKDIALKGLTMQREALQSEAAKFDLTLELGIEQGSIQGVFEYSTDLFDAITIENMVGHYIALLQGIVQNPAAAVGDLRLADDRHIERDSLLTSDQHTLASAFDAQVIKTPDAKALDDGSQVLTYRQLAEKAGIIAGRLQSAGIKPGSIVAVYLPRSNDYLVAMLGILKAGCAYLPLELILPRARIDFILNNANVAAVVSREPEFADFPHISSNDLQQSVALPVQQEVPAQAPAYLIYTSGSTGQPKGVLISHRSALGLVQSLEREIYRHNPKIMNVALMASFIFDASVQQIFAALLQGHCLHICDSESRRDGQALLAFLEKQQIDLTDCTPSLLQIMLEAGLAERPDLRLAQVIVGGEALPPQLIETIAGSSRAGNLNIYNVYGPTECTVDATLHVVDNRRRYLGQAVSIGKALDHAQVKIVDCYGHRQPDGLAGEIYIGGIALAHGYRRQPALTADRFVPAENGLRYYRTGDQGRVNQYGEIEFLGRLDDQVKIRGYRIELGEIEAQLNQYPGILQAAAKVNKGESAEIVAYLVAEKQLSLADLRTGLSRQLPDYMIPAHFVVLDKMPLNPSGKIDRKALPKLSEAARLSDDLGGAPKGEREQALAGVWCAVLGLDSIGRDDNFFASGGDSIKALQIVSRVRQTGWKLEVRDLFSYPSISKLAPKLEALKSAPAELTEAKGEVPLSPIQQHFFAHHRNDFHHFNQAFLLETEDLDTARLRQALIRVCDSHDAFRLRFEFRDGQWRQFYADNGSIDFAELDLASVAQLSAHASELQKSFDLNAGPLIKAVYYRLPGKQYLLLVAHHLVIDGVSWRILMEDLNEAYEQGDRWQAPLPTASLKYWMQQLRRQAEKIIAEQQTYWQQPDLSPCLDGRNVTYSDLDIVKIELDRIHSEQFLTGVHQAYNTEANDLLLAALLLAYSRWANDRRLSLILEGHGRDVLEGVDVSRTIGWFTTRYPVTLEYNASQDLGYLIKSVKESLRAIPDKGVGYGIVRYMNDASIGQRFEDPAISFNYLGQFGQHRQGRFAFAEQNIGDIMSPNAVPPYLIEFVGRHAAGQLSFEIAYPRHLYNLEQISDFAENFKQALSAIIDHATGCDTQSLTPSDIDYDGFDIDQLDDFLAQM